MHAALLQSQSGDQNNRIILLKLSDGNVDINGDNMTCCDDRRIVNNKVYKLGLVRPNTFKLKKLSIKPLKKVPPRYGNTTRPKNVSKEIF